MRRSSRDQTPWQGFADLAMGLMAVLALVLIVMVHEARNAAETATIGRQKAIEIAAGALSAVQALVGEARQASARQAAVMELLRQTFDSPGCELRLDPETGTLLPRADTNSDAGDFFFAPESTELTERAAQAMRSCAEAWRTIGTCLAPPSTATPSCGLTLEDERAWRVEHYDARCKPVHPARSGLAMLSWEPVALGVEALVLEGHTDRSPRSYGRGEPAPVAGATWSNRTLQDSRNFLKNAHLGAERARSAVAHILASIADNREGGNCSVDQILHSRLHVVSPSYGRFLAGPVQRAGWREVTIDGDQPTCDVEEERCDSARTLRLRIRWRDSALRKPLTDLTEQICGQLSDPKSELSKLLDLVVLSDPAARQKVWTTAGCPGVLPSSARARPRPGESTP